MAVLLEGLLPRLFPGLQFRCVPYHGKRDLERRIPRTLQAWRVPGDRFVILMDNDGGDCLALKARLLRLCQESGRGDILVRIVCQELEAWYLGEPEAMAVAFADDSLRRIGQRPRYRNPDSLVNPSYHIKRLFPGFRKVDGARAMAGQLTRHRNRSASFAAFLDGLARLYPDAGA